MPRNPLIPGWLLFTSLLPMWSATAADPAATYTLTKIVDTQTNIPGTTRPFGGFYRPTLQDGVVAFLGYDKSQPEVPVGVYTSPSNGPITVIADGSTLGPDGLPFYGYGEPVLSNGDVVFGGGSRNSSNQVEIRGIYRNRAGSLDTLVDLNTTSPGQINAFTSFRSYDYKDGELAFISQGVDENDDGFDGLFRTTGGAPTVIADDHTSIPGSSELYWLFQSNPIYFGSNVAFSADNSFQTSPMSGVFVSDGTNTSTILNTHYSFYRDLSASDQQLTFCVYDSAVYRYRDGQLTLPIRAYVDRLPDRKFLKLSNITTAAVSGDALAYIGGFQILFTIPTPTIPLVVAIPIHFGLYADFGSGWETIVAQGDTVDGRKVKSLLAGPRSFDGNQIAVRISFSDNSQAIYLATRQVAGTRAASTRR